MLWIVVSRFSFVLSFPAFFGSHLSLLSAMKTMRIPFYRQFSDVDTVLSCLAAAVGFHFPADVRALILCNFWVSQFCNSHLYTIAIIFMIHECFLTSRVLSGDLQFPVTIIFLMLIRYALPCCRSRRRERASESEPPRRNQGCICHFQGPCEN